MEVLCYYLNNKRIAKIPLPKDNKLRTLGRSPKANISIKSAIAEIHIEIRFQNGSFFIFPKEKVFTDNSVLEVNQW